jgi:hypothetical protein
MVTSNGSISNGDLGETKARIRLTYDGKDLQLMLKKIKSNLKMNVVD